MAQIVNAKSVAERTLGNCRICQCKLGGDLDDDEQFGVCAQCKDRPEAKRLGPKLVADQRGGSPSGVDGQKPARDFTPAERALIKKVNRILPAAQLLEILNERLECDLGPEANPYTMEQLQAQIGQDSGGGGKTVSDWAGMRKLIAQARRSGVLARITEQVIQDFAVVYSLKARQVISLKDIVLQAAREDE